MWYTRNSIYTITKKAEKKILFYSRLQSLIEQKVPENTNVNQVLNILNSPKAGVKKDELFWSGLEEWLKAKDPEERIRKEDILEQLRNSNPLIISQDVLSYEDPPKPKWEPVNEVTFKEIRAYLLQNYAKDILNEMLYDTWYYPTFEKVVETWALNNDIDIELEIEEEYGDKESFVLSHVESATKGNEKELLNLLIEEFEDEIITNSDEIVNKNNITYFQSAANDLNLGNDFHYYDSVYNVYARIHTYVKSELYYNIFTSDGKIIISNIPASEFNDIKNIREIAEAVGHEDIEKSEKYKKWSLPGGDDYTETLILWENSNYRYYNPHFDNDQTIAHFRTKDRKNSNNENVLFLEEIQSDWHQAGRERGYKKKINNQIKELLNSELFENAWNELHTKTNEFYNLFSQQIMPYTDFTPLPPLSPNRDVKDFQILFSKHEKFLSLISGYFKEIIKGNDLDSFTFIEDLKNEYKKLKYQKDTAVQDAPFSSTEDWVGLVLKKAVERACLEGHSSLAWTPGEIQNERYDFSDQVDKITLLYPGNNDKTEKVRIRTYKDGIINIDKQIDNKKEAIEEIIGFELHSRLKQQELQNSEEGVYRTIEGELKIDSEGMITFYNKIVPNIVRKLFKKYNGKVSVDNIIICPETAYRDYYKIFSTLQGDHEYNTIIDLFYPEYKNKSIISQKVDNSFKKFISYNDTIDNVYGLAPYKNQQPLPKEVLLDYIPKIKDNYPNFIIESISGIVLNNNKIRLTKIRAIEIISIHDQQLKAEYKAISLMREKSKGIPYSKDRGFGYLPCFSMKITDEMKDSIFSKGLTYYGCRDYNWHRKRS